jgi:uncharacterized protein YkwD
MARTGISRHLAGPVRSTYAYFMSSLLVNILILAVLAFGGYQGCRRGFLHALANLVGLAISFFWAYVFYAPLSDLLVKVWPLPQGIAHIFSFLVLAFVVDGLVTWLVLLASVRWITAPQRPLYYWAGIIPGILSSVVTAGYITSLFVALPLDHPVKTAVTEAALAQPLINLTRHLGNPAEKLVTPALMDLSQLFTIEPGSKDSVKLPFTSDRATINTQAEEGMLVLVNKERTSRGLGSLSMDQKLRAVARLHSLDMFQRGYFSHYTPEGADPFDRMKRANIQYLAAGENLALAPTLDMAHTGLMNSPGHKRNILDPAYRKVGIGAYQDTRYGIMFSQEFSN